MPALPHLDSFPAPLLVHRDSQAKRVERSDWVDMQLVRGFMLHAKTSLPASLVVTWIMAAVMYLSVPLHLLLTWLLVINGVILMRYVVVVKYQASMQGVCGQPLRKFLAKYDVLWTVAGVLWGLSTALFYTNSNGFEQFICTLILVGVCCISVYSYASRLQCFFGFINALCGTVLLAFLYIVLVLRAVPVSVDSLGLITLDVVFFLLLRYFGIRFQSLQRRSLKLQFDNNELIRSLTAKSAAALEAVQNKNRFIASAAHDLRQPVHALNLYASWLVDEPTLSTQVAPHIVRCTQAVNELFNSLFDFSGLNADVTKVNWQQVDLAHLAADLQHQYAPLARERGLQLRLRQRHCVVWSDPVLLKRMLGNLISNALKNTPQGGAVLALRVRADRWRVEVKDTGVGIDKQHQSAIFKEFYRVPKLGTQDGFGLGLAIASRLSRVLAVKLRMRSRPGRGSLFWIEGNVHAAAPRGAVPLTAGLASGPGGSPESGF